MPWCLGDSLTASPVELLVSARGITGCFEQGFFVLSHSMQVKAVVTVRYHVIVMKTTRETRLLVWKVK
jgi:hypothetical protein